MKILPFYSISHIPGRYSQLTVGCAYFGPLHGPISAYIYMHVKLSGFSK